MSQTERQILALGHRFELIHLMNILSYAYISFIRLFENPVWFDTLIQGSE